MNRFAILKGAMVLGITLMRSLFDRKILIYRCPDCNLVVRLGTKYCSRCGVVFDWS